MRRSTIESGNKSLSNGGGRSLKRSAAKVEGYDYAAFCEGIADRDGCDCWVRRNVSLPPEALSCDGQLDGHHVLSKQWLKREFPHGVVFLDDGPTREARRLANAAQAETILLPTAWLPELLNDSRNGILVCRKHHDLLENVRIVIARADLPECVEEFAAELGDRALARLDRDYGQRTEAA